MHFVDHGVNLSEVWTEWTKYTQPNTCGVRQNGGLPGKSTEYGILKFKTEMKEAYWSNNRK